jgi:hypothetical protein
MKKIVILTILAVLAISAFAGQRSFKERSENWLQNNNTEETSGNLRGGIGGDETSEEPDGVLSVPIGESLFLFIFLAGGYILFKQIDRNLKNGMYLVKAGNVLKK